MSRRSDRHIPLSMAGTQWRFLREVGASDQRGAVLTPQAHAYLQRDAQLWREQQEGVMRTPQEMVAFHSEQLAAEEKEIETAQLAEERPKSAKPAPVTIEDSTNSSTETKHDQFDLMSLSPTSAALLKQLDEPLEDLKLTAVAAQAEEKQQIIEPVAIEPEPEQKKHGLIAADLLQHYATKDLIDEERERTRKRERSRWEREEEREPRRRDTGGVMMGGLGLDELPERIVEAKENDESHPETKRDVDLTTSRVDAVDMPDISDFTQRYEQEDEPSFPAIVWRVKERLTEAVDVPPSIAHQLHAVQAHHRKPHHGRRSSLTTVLPTIHPPKQDLLRFNFGAGADYQVVNHRKRSNNQQKQTREVIRSLTAPSASRESRDQYGAWYLPVKHWQKTGDEKTKILDQPPSQPKRRVDSGDEEEDDDEESDAYHGSAWLDRVERLRSQLPSLFCSRSFKAFLMDKKSRVPHYLQPVRPTNIDEQELEEEGEEARPMTAIADHIDDNIEEGEEDDDMVAYLREVKMRELSLAGAHAVKQKQMEVQQRNELRKLQKLERDNRLSMPGGTVDEEDEDDDMKQLDALFDLPDPFIDAFKRATHNDDE